MSGRRPPGGAAVEAWRSAGSAGRPTLPLPPDPMPLVRAGRPLKRWTYVGVFAEDLMLCAGTARVAVVPQSFWAVWNRRAGVLDTETTYLQPTRVRLSDQKVLVRSGAARLELALSPVGETVEVVSPHGRSYIWTRKVPIRADGHLTFGMEARPVSGLGILDQSAGYHARRTRWEWSAGVGTSGDGWPVAWSLARGLHDSATSSERTVWVQGRAVEVPPVRFSADLDKLWGDDGSLLGFEAEAVRTHRTELGLVTSDYEQPFGRFHGLLPGGVDLSEQSPALGVMERHRARW